MYTVKTGKHRHCQRVGSSPRPGRCSWHKQSKETLRRTLRGLFFSRVHYKPRCNWHSEIWLCIILKTSWKLVLTKFCSQFVYIFHAARRMSEISPYILNFLVGSLPPPTTHTPVTGRGKSSTGSSLETYSSSGVRRTRCRVHLPGSLPSTGSPLFNLWSSATGPDVSTRLW